MSLPANATAPERGPLPPIRITSIRSAALSGESPEGGWANEIKAEDSIHALLAVHTDGLCQVIKTRLSDPLVKIISLLLTGARHLLPRLEGFSPQSPIVTGFQ